MSRCLWVRRTLRVRRSLRMRLALRVGRSLRVRRTLRMRSRLRVSRALRVGCGLPVRLALRMGCTVRARRALRVRLALRVRRNLRVGLALRVGRNLWVRRAWWMLCLVSSGLLCGRCPGRLLRRRRRMPLLAPRLLRDRCRWAGLCGWRVGRLVSSTRSGGYELVFYKWRRLRRQSLGNRMGIGEVLPHLSPLSHWYILPTAFDLGGSQLPPRLRPD